MAQGGSIWSLSGPHSQDDRPERRHSTWRLKRRRGEHDKHMFLSNSCIMIHKHTILTISWHHTQRLPAKVLIFLWQIWHLLDLQSALIQSWDATWDTEEQKQGWCPTTATFFFFSSITLLFKYYYFQHVYTHTAEGAAIPSIGFTFLCNVWTGLKMQIQFSRTMFMFATVVLAKQSSPEWLQEKLHHYGFF